MYNDTENYGSWIRGDSVSVAIASRTGGRDGTGRGTIATTGTGMAIYCNNAELLGGRGDTTKQRELGCCSQLSIEV